MNESDRIRFKRAKTLARNPAAPGEQYDGETHIATVVGRQPVYFEKKLVIPCCRRSVTPEGEVVYFTVLFTQSRGRNISRASDITIAAYTTINLENVPLTSVETTQEGVTSINMVGPVGGSEISLEMSGISVGQVISVSTGNGNTTVENAQVNVENLTADAIDIILDNLVEIVNGSLTTPTSILVDANKTKYISTTSTDISITGSSIVSVNMTGGSLNAVGSLTVESLIYNDAVINGDITIVPSSPNGTLLTSISGEYINFTFEGTPTLSTGWEIANYYSESLPVTTSSTLSFVDLSNSGYSYQPPSHIAGYFACLFRESANTSNASAMSDPTGFIIFAKKPTATRANTSFPDPPSSTITISSPSAPSGYEVRYYGGVNIETLTPTINNSNIITLPGPPIPYVVAVKIRNIADNTIISDISVPRSI